MSRQRASAPDTESRSVSRISWSSAPRLSGFEIRIRTTLSAGSSTSSLPDASSVLLKDDQGVALRDRLPLLHEDLLDGALVLRLDRHLHLHRFEDRDGVALRDLLTDLALDLPHRAGDVRLDVRQLRSSSKTGIRHDTRPWSGNWLWSSAPGTRRIGSARRSRRCATRSPARP